MHRARVAILAVLAAVAVHDVARGEERQLGSHHGRIDLVHVDGAIPARGPCIVMQPDIPGKSAWACLWQDNPLYPELRELILAAFTAGKRCTVYWQSADLYGHKIVQSLECWRG